MSWRFSTKARQAVTTHAKCYLVRWVVGLLAGLGVVYPCGCGLIGLFSSECTLTEPSPPATDLPALAAAIRYLKHTQIEADRVAGNRMDYAGDWPQCFHFGSGGFFVRDISPFIPAFIHHALSLITAENRDVLGLSVEEVESARVMRQRAVEFMRRFEASAGEPDAGTFGFWPEPKRRWRLGDRFLAGLIGLACSDSSQLMGVRMPANVSFFPEDFAIPTDADTTAVMYGALLDHALLDGGEPKEIAFEAFFENWRDLGQVPQRNKHPWLPSASGAFLTWLVYRDDPSNPKPNEVDIIVNASVLYALGRYGRLDTEGVSEAVSLINAALKSGAHLSDPAKLSLYYPDNLALHYIITRAYAEGRVESLAPSVDLLIEDLLATMRTDEDGNAFWDRGASHLNTAFAVLSWLNANRPRKAIEPAVNYLLAVQDRAVGAWDSGVFCVARLADGTEIGWSSRAFTTAIALEAIARYRLQD